MAERRCPTCGKPAAERWRPFCSKRCADLDLGRWLGERYRIPAVDDDADADADADGEEGTGTGGTEAGGEPDPNA